MTTHVDPVRRDANGGGQPREVSREREQLRVAQDALDLAAARRSARDRSYQAARDGYEGSFYILRLPLHAGQVEYRVVEDYGLDREAVVPFLVEVYRGGERVGGEAP